jgi:hypothetical protein
MRKIKPASPRVWEVYRPRARAEYLGRVEAEDEAAAYEEAARAFALDRIEATRLLVRQSQR